MIKYTLLAIALLAPLAFAAKAPVSKEAPFPICYPCEKDKSSRVETVIAAAKEAPFPICYPCGK